MREIDEMRIHREGGKFVLALYYEDGSKVGDMHYVIGLPDQFHAETVRALGPWVTENEGDGREPDGQRYAGGGQWVATDR